jgi:hypothetical protein
MNSEFGVRQALGPPIVFQGDGDVGINQTVAVEGRGDLGSEI